MVAALRVMALGRGMTDKNIVLTGFMGTGKTAVGRVLACWLGREFVDMDSELESRACKPINRIFAEDGEPAFRAMECALAEELGGRRNLVIAAGGGAVLDPRNVEALSRSGILICLRASPAEILRRIGNDNCRPLLACADRQKRIAQLLAEREAAYSRLPHHVATDGLSPGDVAQKILGLLNSLTASSHGSCR